MSAIRAGEHDIGRLPARGDEVYCVPLTVVYLEVERDEDGAPFGVQGVGRDATGGTTLIFGWREPFEVLPWGQIEERTSNDRLTASPPSRVFTPAQRCTKLDQHTTLNKAQKTSSYESVHIRP